MAGAAAALIILAGPAGAATPGPPPAAPQPDEATAAAETFAMRQDASARLSLPVFINGHGPYPFLVDTGSDHTVIDRDLAASLSLADGPRVVVHDSAGADPARTVRIDRLDVDAREVRGVVAAALLARDIGAPGMLGVDALRDLHLVMDFQAMRLSTTPSRSEPVDDRTIVVRGQSRFGQLILANSTIKGQRVLVVLDSGSQVSIGNPALLKLLTGRTPQAAPPRTTDLLTATGRRLTVEVDQVAEAQVGGVTIRNMPLAFAQLHTFDRFGLTRQPALLLGMDVLSLCRKVTVDLRRREATFTLN